MEILDLKIGDLSNANEDSLKIEKTAKHGGKGSTRFLVYDNNQKFKLTDDVHFIDESMKAYNRNITSNHMVSYYNLDGDRYLVKPNNYSFNPMIMVNKGREDDPSYDPYAEKNIVFITIDTTKFKQLRYYTNMEIISVFNSKARSRMGCVAVYDTRDVEDVYFVINGLCEKQFVSYKIGKAEDAMRMDVTRSTKFHPKQLSTLRAVRDKYNGKPLRFKYCGKSLPYHVICRESDEIDLCFLIEEFTGIKPDERYDFHTVHDDFDFSDTNLVNSVIGDWAKFTKGILIGPNVTINRDVAYRNGLMYLLQFDKSRDGKLILQQRYPVD